MTSASAVRRGQIIEFGDEQIEKRQTAVGRKYNLQLVEHKLGIGGYCDQRKVKDFFLLVYCDCSAIASTTKIAKTGVQAGKA